MNTTKSKYVFDFEELRKLFAEICPDFSEEISYDTATVSRRFAEQVIFEFGKQAKEAKAQGKDKIWKLRLDIERENSKPAKIMIIISTYNTKPPPQQQPFLLHGHLQLTFKQASLLAVAKYCQLVQHLLKRDQIVLTPLAGAVFSQNDMPKLAKELNEPLQDLVIAVISSCQTDGYYLEHSRCYIAVAAIIKTVSDQQMRVSIVKKTIKMYKQQNKEFDMTKFKICSRFMQASYRSATSINYEIDVLVSHIMAFNLTDSKDRANNIIKQVNNKKPPLLCAANFNNNGRK